MNIFKRAWNGVSNGIQAVADYLPRGILFSAALIGGSALIGQVAPSLDLLGINTIFTQKGLEGVGTRLLASVAFGSVITGAIGTAQGAFASAKEEAVSAPQSAGTPPVRAQGQQRAPELDYASNVAPQRDLPMKKPIGKAPAATPGLFG